MSRMIVSILVVATLSACSQRAVRPKMNSDALFQEIVLKQLPNYKLTRSLIGRSVQKSDGYTSKYVASSASFGEASDPAPARDNIVKTFRPFEASGVGPVDIYFDQNTSGGRIYWMAEFPGCSERTCISTAKIAPLKKVSRLQWENYRGSFEAIELDSAEIDGVKYWATVYIDSDHRGRIVKYTIKSEREAVYTGELLNNHLNRKNGGTNRIVTFKYINNMAFGISGQAYSNGLRYGQIDRDKQL